MLTIAICDDQKEQLKRTAELLHAYLNARPTLQGRIFTFTNGAALLAHAESQNGFDIYLLDILMPGLDGIQTGQRLRELRDGGEIIYLSSSNEYALDSYDVRAFFYLLKPIEAQKLFHVLDSAVEKLTRRKSNAVIVATRNGPRRILLEQIRYVERFGCSMRYHCMEGTVDSQTIRVTFKEATASLLADSRFCLCGASFVLNFQHVVGVSGQSALLDNGASVPLPRAAATAFKDAWGKYWLEQMPTP